MKGEIHLTHPTGEAFPSRPESWNNRGTRAVDAGSNLPVLSADIREEQSLRPPTDPDLYGGRRAPKVRREL